MTDYKRAYQKGQIRDIREGAQYALPEQTNRSVGPGSRAQTRVATIAVAGDASEESSLEKRRTELA
eukprot:15446456-Alexandrium_andersonii.AAC.1